MGQLHVYLDFLWQFRYRRTWTDATHLPMRDVRRLALRPCCAGCCVPCMPPLSPNPPRPAQLKAQAPPVMEIVLFAIRGTYHKQGFGTVLAAALYELARAGAAPPPTG